MARWIVLLRGINVGGHRKIPMAELRQSLANAGFLNVTSYIQSGNVVADFDVSAQQARRAVSQAISDKFGFTVDVVLLTPSQLSQAIADMPFDGTNVDPARLHLFFHLDPNAAEDIADLTKLDGKDACAPGAIAHYLATPDGMSRSKLAEQLSRRLTGKATGRNLRTCLKLDEMAKTQ